MEQYYAFIKDGIVQEICVFANQDEELADRISHEKGFDDAVWLETNLPKRYSSYDGTTFTDPTNEYLISIGVITPAPEVTE